jgi:murein DD-endopeptidase MepM/ murein hydrolase activator NlpD
MNQAVAFGLVFGGGILLTSALTGSSLADVTKGHPGSIGQGGQLSAAGTVARSGVAGVGSVIASLFPKGTSVTPRRRDQGRDLQAPANTPVLAPGAGYLLRNGNDPHGFGDAYPIVHFTSGPWAGEDVYFGHTMSLLLTPGVQFAAGTPLAMTQNGKGPFVGNATGLPGWAEIGLAPGGSPGRMGQPLPAGL